jgi:small subunit ribosomal protein S6
MRNYELTVIFDIADDNVTAGRELVAGELKNIGASIAKEDDLGVKFLAYPIKKNEKGHYCYYELQADPAKIVGLERSFKLADPILKFLFVNKEK